MARTTCQRCGAPISQTPACFHCGFPTGESGRAPRPYRWLRVIVFSSLIVIAIAGIQVAWSYVQERIKIAGGPVAAEKAPISIGDMVSVDNGHSLCALAVDDAAWDLMLNIQNAGGSLIPLIDSGRVIVAARGSKAIVIRKGFGSVQLQFVGGPLSGALAWVQVESVKPM